MSRPIIEVDCLSKRYRLGQYNAHTLRDEVEHLFRRLRTHGPSGRPPDAADLWALRDVSFDVQPGEVLGVIGRNGAGKSTLLKILSRITEPTSGEARIRGRVASLLEVGAGFHPELTGLENIYLNGTILGMTKAEVRRRFDEIVAFAEIDRFIDTPVKRYSSGMYVRLAFAVAAHLDPEVLIVDEVLAVGDAAFQRKCLGKMGEVARTGGRTVLFVSHNMPSVEALCDRGLYLDAGRVTLAGACSDVVTAYMRDNAEQSRSAVDSGATRHIRALVLRGQNGEPRDAFRIGEDIVFETELYAEQSIDHPRYGIAISSPRGDRVTTLHTDIQNKEKWAFRGTRILRVVWKQVPLNVGRYRVDVSLWDHGHELESLVDCRTLEIQPRDVYLTGQLPDPSYQGYLIPDASWSVRFSRDT